MPVQLAGGNGHLYRRRYEVNVEPAAIGPITRNRKGTRSAPIHAQLESLSLIEPPAGDRVLTDGIASLGHDHADGGVTFAILLKNPHRDGAVTRSHGYVKRGSPSSVPSEFTNLQVGFQPICGTDVLECPE